MYPVVTICFIAAMSLFLKTRPVRGLVCRDRFRRDNTRVEREANGLLGSRALVHGEGCTSRDGCLYQRGFRYDGFREERGACQNLTYL